MTILDRQPRMLLHCFKDKSMALIFLKPESGNSF